MFHDILTARELVAYYLLDLFFRRYVRHTSSVPLVLTVVPLLGLNVKHIERAPLEDMIAAKIAHTLV